MGLGFKAIVVIIISFIMLDKSSAFRSIHFILVGYVLLDSLISAIVVLSGHENNNYDKKCIDCNEFQTSWICPSCQK